MSRGGQEAVYGLHSAQALLGRAPQRVLAIYVDKARRDRRLEQLTALAQSQGLSLQPVAKAELERLADGGNHQGVVVLARPAPVHDEAFLLQTLAELERPALVLVLDGVTDPHNLGACLRSAEAAGVDAVVAPKDKSAGLNATARKVACGAAEVLPFVPVTNLARTLKKLQQAGLWLVGAAGEASQSIYQVDLSGSIALVMGAEGQGLRRLTRESCDYLAHIPMHGSVSSLNVSVATGVCLFEAARQRSA